MSVRLSQADYSLKENKENLFRSLVKWRGKGSNKIDIIRQLKAFSSKLI